MTGSRACWFVVLASCSSSSSAEAPPVDASTDTSVTADAPADSGPYTLPNLDAACDGGPTGKQLMALVRPSYGGTYTPPGSRPAAPPWTGSTKPSALTIAVSYAGGAIICTPKFKPECPPGAPCAAPRPPVVNIDLAMTFTTADGTLNESLVATASLQGGDSSVNWTSNHPATKLAGSYPISAGTAAETRLSFNGRFLGDANDGNLSEMTAKISFDGGSWKASAGAADGGVDAPGD